MDTAVQLLGSMSYLPEEFGGMSIGQQRWHLESLLSGMVYDPARSMGIGWNLNNVRRVAWPLKERLSQDTWRVLQQLETELSVSVPVNREYRLLAQMNLLDRVIVILSAFAGLLTENSTRGHGWHFLQIGKRLERALQTSELLLAVFVDGPFDLDPAMRTLLQIADSSITYRLRHFTTLRPEYALELLLKDEGNPRSLLFQLVGLMRHLGQLPGYMESANTLLPARLAASALAQVRGASVAELSARDSEGNMPALEELTRQLKGTLYDISDALAAQHFSHLTTTRLTPIF
jgi:uncharacterized alpha-E superfamily protein